MEMGTALLAALEFYLVCVGVLAFGWASWSLFDSLAAVVRHARHGTNGVEHAVAVARIVREMGRWLSSVVVIIAAIHLVIFPQTTDAIFTDGHTHWEIIRVAVVGKLALAVIASLMTVSLIVDWRMRVRARQHE